MFNFEVNDFDGLAYITALGGWSVAHNPLADGPVRKADRSLCSVSEDSGPDSEHVENPTKIILVSEELR